VTNSEVKKKEDAMKLFSTFTPLHPYSLGDRTTCELHHLSHCWWGILSGPDIAKVVFIVVIVTSLDASETIKLIYNSFV